MKKCLTVLILFVGCIGTKPSVEDKPETNVQGVLSELQSFVDASKPGRCVGEAGHDKAAEYIRSKFTRLLNDSNGKIYIHDFKPDTIFAVKNYKNDFKTLIEKKFKKTDSEYKKWKGFTNRAVRFVRMYRRRKGQNIVFEIKGSEKPSEVVYVGAHYDTITHDHKTLQFTPKTATSGADDNASGVAVLLETARSLSKAKPKKTIRFVAFDFEEIFFLGSYALAKSLKKKDLEWTGRDEKVIGLVNLEMVGWSKTAIDQHPVVKIYTRIDKNSPDLALASDVTKAAGEINSPLKPVVLNNGFNRSDNWTFWQLGIPAICISEDWEGDFNEQNYHTASDRPETLNRDYLEAVQRLVLQAVTDLAEAN